MDVKVIMILIKFHDSLRFILNTIIIYSFFANQAWSF